jgi:hypothetical protein
MNQAENYESNCTDVMNGEGQVLGAVCVSIGKKPGSRDILFMSRDKVGLIGKTTHKGRTFSVRSVTEMLNILAGWNVTYDERKRVHNFVTERLRILEQQKP